VCYLAQQQRFLLPIRELIAIGIRDGVIRRPDLAQVAAELVCPHVFQSPAQHR
jgi:hypothetical protein